MSSDAVSRWDDLTPYSPPAHQGTSNRRLLTGEQTGGRLSMVHGRLQPGGRAERHLHRHSAQITHILAGRCTVDLDGEIDTLGPGDTVYIAPGRRHEVVVDGDEPLELVNVYQPPLQPDDIRTDPDAP